MRIYSLTMAALVTLVALASCAGAPVNVVRCDFRPAYTTPVERLFDQRPAIMRALDR